MNDHDMWTRWCRLQQNWDCVALASAAENRRKKNHIQPHKNHRVFATSTVISYYDMPQQYNVILVCSSIIYTNPVLGFPLVESYICRNGCYLLGKDRIWCSPSLSPAMSKLSDSVQTAVSQLWEICGSIPSMLLQTWKSLVPSFHIPSFVFPLQRHYSETCLHWVQLRYNYIDQPWWTVCQSVTAMFKGML